MLQKNKTKLLKRLITFTNIKNETKGLSSFLYIDPHCAGIYNWCILNEPSQFGFLGVSKPGIPPIMVKFLPKSAIIWTSSTRTNPQTLPNSEKFWSLGNYGRKVTVLPTSAKSGKRKNPKIWHTPINVLHFSEISISIKCLWGEARILLLLAIFTAVFTYKWSHYFAEVGKKMN